MNEGKKDRRDPIRTIKPKNPVAKNANAAIGGGAAGAHKDKSKTIPRKEKHKNAEYAESLQARLNVALLEEFDSPEYNDEAGMANGNLLTLARAVKGLLDTIEPGDNLPEWCQEKIAKSEMMLVTVWDYLLSQKEQGIEPKVSESRYDRRDAYQRDYDSSISGMGKRQSYAYQQDGGANDEYNTPEYDPEFQRNRQETMMYNVTVDGKSVTPKPLLGRSAAIAWAKEQIAAGKLDPKVAKLSPVKYDQDVAEGLPQTLRKVVPGYAKREIDKKMDDQKFGRTDVDKDANYYRYKKIQDKIKNKGVAEAIGKKDLLNKLQKDLPKVTDPKNKDAKPVGWTGPGKDDYGYTGYQGHGMPTDKQERDRIRADKKKGVAEGSGGNWYIRINGKILNDTKFKPVIFSSEDEARSHAMKLADKKSIPLSQMKLTKSWMDAPEQGVAEDKDPCWKNYKQIGMKKKGGKKVPNCVPKEGWTHDSLAAQLFETENTYEDKLSNLLNKRLGK